jgi:hypothetical protein
LQTGSNLTPIELKTQFPEKRPFGNKKKRPLTALDFQARRIYVSEKSDTFRSTRATLRAAQASAGRLPTINPSRINRVLKNKHQAVSQGARRFGKRSIFNDM